MDKDYKATFKRFRMWFADECVIEDCDGKKQLLTKCNFSDKRYGGRVAVADVMERRKGGFFEWKNQDEKAFNLGYFDRKGKVFYLLARHCSEYHIWDGKVFFCKNKNIWMFFDLKTGKFTRLGSLVRGFWRSPLSDKYGLHNSGKVRVFFLTDQWKVVQKEYDNIFKVYNQDVYMFVNFADKNVVDYATNFKNGGVLPRVGEFGENVSINHFMKKTGISMPQFF